MSASCGDSPCIFQFPTIKGRIKGALPAESWSAMVRETLLTFAKIGALALTLCALADMAQAGAPTDRSQALAEQTVACIPKGQAMLRSIKELENAAISATDGLIGQVTDCCFDDDAWLIRYLVAEAGSWLSSRKLLISPNSFRHPDWSAHRLAFAMAQEQVKQPRYRHRQVGVTAAGSANPSPLRLSELLGRCGLSHPGERRQDRAWDGRPDRR